MTGAKLGITDEGLKKIAKAGEKQAAKPAPKVAQESGGSEYVRTVQSIAEDIKERWKNGEVDDINEAIWEDVDGNHYIIYYSANMEVLQESRNDDAISDAGVEIDTSKGWRAILTQVAFYAMEADVRDALTDLGWDGMDSFEDEEEEEAEEPEYDTMPEEVPEEEPQV